MAAAAQASATRQVEHAGAGQRDGQGEDADAEPGAARLDRVEAAAGQRQAAHPVDHVRQLVGVALQQQDVARLDRQMAQPVAELLAAPRYAQQMDAEAVLEAQVHGAAAEDAGAEGRDHLHDGYVAAGQARGLGAGGGGVLELQAGDEALEILRPGLDHQQVAFADLGVARHARQALARAHQADDVDFVLGHQLVQFADLASDDLAILRDPGLGDVVLELEGLRRGGAQAILGDQPPADQRDEEHTGQGAGPADRREVEHGVRRAQGVLAEGGHDDVGRRADQGHQTAQDGGEGQRHKGQRGRALGLLGRLDVDRHEQRQRAHIVHER